MKFNTKDINNIKCLTTFEDWKSGRLDNIKYQEEKAKEFEAEVKQELADLKRQLAERTLEAKKEILEKKAYVKRVIQNTKDHLTFQDYQKDVTKGIEDMKKFMIEHPTIFKKEE